MNIPYKVSVVSKGKNDISVVIKPQPIASKEQFALVVTGRFQHAILNPSIQNTLIGRAKLKKELEEILTDFHKQGIIKPKEDEGNL